MLFKLAFDRGGKNFIRNACSFPLKVVASLLGVIRLKY